MCLLLVNPGPVDIIQPNFLKSETSEEKIGFQCILDEIPHSF